MPTPSSGRRSSKSGPSGSEASKSSERREKAKSSQAYDTQRRGSRQAESTLGSVSEPPRLNGRTHSAPLVDRAGKAQRRDDLQDGEQMRKQSKSSSTPRAGAGAGDAQDEDEVAGVVGAVKRFQPFQSPELSEPLRDINIAVLGAEGVGKSTFVQRALELSRPPPAQASERKISIKGSDYLVRLLELPIDDVDIDDEDNTVSWPETIENKMMPRVDGVLTLYDVKDESSLECIPEMLRAIDKAGIPSQLVSCKCDVLVEQREVNPVEVEERARRSLKRLSTVQTSAGLPETHKRSLSKILRDILSQPPVDHMRSSQSPRRRAQSNAVRPVSPRPPSGGHTRSTSEYTGSLSKEQKDSRHDSRVAGYGVNDRLKVPHEVPQEEMGGSFLFEESASENSPESTRSSEDISPPPVPSLQPVALSENGVTFDELVDRLLAQPTSKADGKFASMFLALYRKFAAPSRLLEAIVERFDSLDRNGNAQMTKTSDQLRYMAIVEQWIGTYPGDFAYPKTRRQMGVFVGKLAQVRIFSVAANEMNKDLDAVHEDDDTNWSYCDKDRVTTGDDARMSLSSEARALIDDATFLSTEDFTLTGSTLRNDSNIATSDGSSGRPSSTTSSQIMVNVEAAQRQAQLLQPIPRQAITKFQWRLLMECPDDVIARELTRMDWIMFSSIRPRDLVRQVSLNDAQKAQCKNLSHVNRMSDHFNQLACWVANYILLRDKPKHRAFMLEKLMRIARKLREMNNYNALGAMIAGIKSSAVHRLAATRELIPPNVGKDWMKLEILMAPSRSYSAYRLAWENSASERIPYIPLHLRDLVSAEQGNKTFTGEENDGGINWKKFEVMGEVVVSMQKAQGMPYRGLGGGRGNEYIKELVLDVRLVKDEDELHERSKQIEPTGSVTGGTSTKFKDFFKR